MHSVCADQTKAFVKMTEFVWNDVDSQTLSPVCCKCLAAAVKPYFVDSLAMHIQNEDVAVYEDVVLCIENR